MQRKNQEQLKQAFETIVEPLIKKVPLSDATFPVLKSTYSLWRSLVFDKCIQASSPNRNSLIYQMFLLSERKYLRDFIDKIQADMARSMKEVTLSLELKSQSDRTSELAFQLGELMWSQQLYLELIEDLMNLPYLSVFEEGTQFLVREEYITNFTPPQKKPKLIEKVYNKIHNTFLQKAFNVITETIVNRTFFMEINTIIGTFNPLLMGASFGLGHYLSYRGAKAKQQQIICQLQGAVSATSKRVEKLKQSYESALSIINILLSGQLTDPSSLSQNQTSLQALFLTFYQQEWLQIKVQQDGEWEVVNIMEKQEFQTL